MPAYTEVNPGLLGGANQQQRASNIPTVVVTPDQYTEQSGNIVQVGCNNIGYAQWSVGVVHDRANVRAGRVKS